jgi:non-ribosomal peptide synthetase component F
VLLATCKNPVQLSSLRCLALGGEVLNPETLALAQRMLPHATIYNCYGPTEASVMVTAYNCTSAPAAQMLSVPIGKAIPGTALYILDPGSLQLVQL